MSVCTRRFRDSSLPVYIVFHHTETIVEELLLLIVAIYLYLFSADSLYTVVLRRIFGKQKIVVSWLKALLSITLIADSSSSTLEIHCFLRIKLHLAVQS